MQFYRLIITEYVTVLLWQRFVDGYITVINVSVAIIIIYESKINNISHLLLL